MIFTVKVELFESEVMVYLDEPFATLTKDVKEKFGYEFCDFDRDTLGGVIFKKGSVDFFLWLQGVQLSNIMHEVSHISFRILMEIGHKFNSSNDEVFCYLQSFLFKKISKECLDRKAKQNGGKIKMDI